MFTKTVRSSSFARSLIMGLLVVASILGMAVSPMSALAAGSPAVGQTAQGTPIVVATVTSNCRQGPSTGYMVVGYLNAGQSAPVIGRLSDNSWWQIQNPNASASCWVWGGITQLQGDVNAVAVVAAPPVAYAAPAYTAPYAAPVYSAPYYAPYYAPFYYTNPRMFFGVPRNFRGFPFFFNRRDRDDRP